MGYESGAGDSVLTPASSTPASRARWGARPMPATTSEAIVYRVADR